MKKKITALLLGAALTVTSLVGCGNDASQNEAETTETQTTEDDAGGRRTSSAYRAGC